MIICSLTWILWFCCNSYLSGYLVKENDIISLSIFIIGIPVMFSTTETILKQNCSGHWIVT